MISASDRRKAVELIDTARSSGARLAPACQTMGICDRTYQRWTRGGGLNEDGRPDANRPVPANKLSDEERQSVLKVCHQTEYASLPPGQIVPSLADQGRYLASESSFYRILHAAGEQHHRGRSRKPNRSTPPKGYCATAPNRVWSWDVTWLPAPIRGMFFYLYMIVDIYSRKIVGWEVHTHESSELAAALIQKAVLSEGCQLDPPVLHADNGSPQKGFTMKAKLESLGVTASYSRPRVSNDNPYSESLFRTLKYRPVYPVKGFENIAAARKWCLAFVSWYNEEHLHSALRYVTPSQRHSGADRQILANRQEVYREAKQRRPERWTQTTRNWNPIGGVWLNGPGKGAVEGHPEVEQAA
jgi:transposase InsO family protein